MSDWVILGIDCSFPHRVIFAYVKGSRLLPKRLLVFLGLFANVLIIPLSRVRCVTIRSASAYSWVFRTIPLVLVSTLISVICFFYLCNSDYMTFSKSSGLKFFNHSSSSSLFLCSITLSSTKIGEFVLIATAIASLGLESMGTSTPLF